MLFFIGAVVLYIFFVGAAYPGRLRKLASDCPFSGHAHYKMSQDGNFPTIPCEKKHADQALLHSALGPVLFVFGAGTRLSRHGREENRKRREIENAKHSLELAKIKTKETEEVARQWALVEKG